VIVQMDEETRKSRPLSETSRQRLIGLAGPTAGLTPHP
jgi:hypothetical protein